MEIRQGHLSLDDLLNNDVISDSEDSTRCRWCGTVFSSVDQDRCNECRMLRRRRTLSEMGATLPIGIKSGNVFNRSFEAVPITYAVEREIRRAWGSSRRISVAEHTATILSHTIKSVGGVPLGAKSHDHRVLIFNQMYQADVLFMYAYVRLLSMGKEMTLKGLRCPSCNAEFDFPCDVGSMEVVELPPDIMTREIVLQDGFKTGERVKKRIVVGPPMWLAWGNQLKKNPTTLDLFASMLSSAIINIEDTPDGVTLTDSELMQLTKTDLEICEYELGMLNAGPLWEVSGVCPSCGEKFFFSLDWSYDSFFSRSYRSPRSRT